MPVPRLVGAGATSTFLPLMSKSRLPLIDAMKGLGCLAIVLHHLAFYGPMSDVVAQAWPAAIEGLISYARLAVQMFFVLGGYLVAQRLAPDGRPSERTSLRMIVDRYKRLVTPFLFAVALATLITALVRPRFDHDSRSDKPTVLQMIAHLLLLHDILGYQALSAGVWYVAIDFQLFTISVILTLLLRNGRPAWRTAFPVLIVVLSALSLWLVNRYSDYENFAPYFFGAYGLGMLAWWSTRSETGGIALAAITALGAIALWIDFRNPVAVALATALIVSVSGQKGWLADWPREGALTWLGQRSYSIFLIHYGICIGVNAAWSVLFPTGVWINLLGMLLAVLASVLAGTLLYHFVESRPAVFRQPWAWTSLAAMVLGALLIETIAW